MRSGHGHGLDLVMSHIDHGGAEILVKLHDLHAHVDAQRGIEIRKRFIEKEALGLAHDGAADGNALALTARELARLAVEIFGEVQRGGSLRHFGLDLGLRHACHLEAEADIVPDTHVRIERVRLEHHRKAALRWRRLGDVLSIDEDLA